MRRSDAALADASVTRQKQTARQIHLHRGCYPFYYEKPRPQSDDEWQADIDERIKYGIAQATRLGVLREHATVIAVQGWRSGCAHRCSERADHRSLLFEHVRCAHDEPC